MTSFSLPVVVRFFFFNDTATTEIYTLSLHDALPISPAAVRGAARAGGGSHTVRVRRGVARSDPVAGRAAEDRKSTRLNSSHSQISYAVFCLKKKKTSRSTVGFFDACEEYLHTRVTDQ